MGSYVGGAIGTFILFQVAAVIALKIRRNDLADVVWGLGFIAALIGGLLGSAMAGRDLLFGLVEIAVLSCIALWGLRLSIHIGRRFFRKSKEDERYAKWREEWGKTVAWRSYLQVFVLQSLIAFVVVLPALSAIDQAPLPLTILSLVGFCMWVAGFIFESVGDAQLTRFSRNPANKGKIIESGLWRWSRHPNYFGEVTQWWGIFLMAFTLQTWWLIVSPLTITFLILKVSGVPMLEEIMKKKPGYADYARRTSKFFPLPPKP